MILSMMSFKNNPEAFTLRDTAKILQGVGGKIFPTELDKDPEFISSQIDRCHLKIKGILSFAFEIYSQAEYFLEERLKILRFFMDSVQNLQKAAEQIIQKGPILVFTGAGISVESGIPTFRGPGGLWEKYNPDFFDIDHFLEDPRECWAKIREIFYEDWGRFHPNAGHRALAQLQKEGFVHTLVTQNIDCLHQEAGSDDVVEFHGTLSRLRCMRCSFCGPAEKSLLEEAVP